MGSAAGRTRRATSADVARLAGVSRATVSYVLNDAPHQTIPEATRHRVLEAAARLQYHASPAARALRTGRSDVVLVLLPAVRYSHVYAEFLAALSLVLGEAGRTLVVHPLAPDTLSLRDVWRTLTPDAVLALGPLEDADVVAMRAAGIEVALALSAQAPRGPWEVGVGDEPVSTLQVEHLLGLGHQRLAFVLPDDDRVRALAPGRLAAFRAGAAAGGASVVVTELDPADPDAPLAALLAVDLAPTAVAAWDDEVAVAVVGAAQRAGVDVPGRLAVVGAYDHAVGLLSRPRVSTVRVDVPARARSVGAALIAAVEGAPMELAPLDGATLEVLRRGTT